MAVGIFLFFVTVGSAFGLDLPAQLDNLTFVDDGSYPPFKFVEDGDLKGFSIDLMDAMLKSMGFGLNQSKVVVMAWSEAYTTVKTVQDTVLMCVVRLPERESDFKWVGPVYSIEDGLLSLKKRNITINSSQDLNMYRIATTHNDSAEILLLRAGADARNLVYEDEDEVIIEMLENGTIDAWAMEEMGARMMIADSGYNPDDYEQVYVLGKNDLYFAFNRKTPDDLIARFQEALEYVMGNNQVDGSSDYEKLVFRYMPVKYGRVNVTDDQVMLLADRACEELQLNASAALKNISTRALPYWNPEQPELYAFVFDTQLNVLANPANPINVGQNFSGKTDVAGNPFRDEILAGAMQNGSGWVDYVYSHPTQSGMFYKKAYYRLVTGSDGKQYIVCTAKYIEG